MGAAFSCIDPNREQGVSPAKKHPGRAEAIAEYKARKNAGKGAATRAPTDTVTHSEPPLPVAVADDDLPAPVVVDDQPPKAEDAIEHVTDELDEKAVLTTSEENTEKTADEDTELIKDVEQDATTATVANEQPEQLPDTTEPADKSTIVEDAVAEPVAALPDDAQPETPTEKPDDTADDAVETPKVEEKSAPTDVPSLAVGAIVGDDDDSSSSTNKKGMIASEAQMKTPTISPLINARRMIFEQGVDTIPEAKELNYDVQDPVTGEYVTLEEYRLRQAERAQGVVKEHVEKYEELDEKALKEMETLKLQEESRTLQREVRSWSKPEVSSGPSSPMEPRRLAELDLPPSPPPQSKSPAKSPAKSPTPAQ